ncbi:tryptophan halogenase family protein [Sphingomonas sp. ASV193]|uniref:tryptophan halogenase family protein n=1 Tax=Sphingomonas sp. ASV193 TaxID=3144405 RepID=UPI0032E8DD19
MSSPVERVVIVGGGTAGWLSAATLAAWSRQPGNPRLAITLIEAPDIPTIGVGEGSWPTMRATLAAIGISETEFLAACDASFKQGSRFDGWATGAAGDSYLHPFTPPALADARQLVAGWRAVGADRPFAEVVTAQAALSAKALAPRQGEIADYAGAVNYGYHLDAGKFAALLRDHAVGRLGVNHLADRIVAVDGPRGERIDAVRTASGACIAGDLFLDCSGLRGLLIGDHLDGGWVDRSDVLLNDRALAAQVPAPDGPIASQTVGTAHEAGWLWDIALPSRRGIGCVYSSRFIDDEAARAILDRYVGKQVPGARDYPVRRIEFPTGHRARFWVGNCLAVGLSAGFIEPLEASAIVLVEVSLRALTESFPRTAKQMPFLASRFDALFAMRWARIVEFLKLHYALSTREEPYWRAQRAPASIPDRLAGLLALWSDQPPSASDLPLADEMFPAASYQYVYYGLGGAVPAGLPDASAETIEALRRVEQRARALAAAMPSNRDLLGHGQPIISQRAVS